ncbi:thiol:disulfide interchange protein [Sphingomonas sp. Leaf17]|uniref:TlpA family protein disulfide reductase n=1 Tax=Sphingomonas sp. Leaf17 TaxID=1735683 RepID=UPI0006F3078E|nr:TlpA disulfide reductase family protein [Sphingomonas sp. Leaf17]KQM65137.1 thiol:disulfide interchange protein [Sphingomonas sp. Leaf17]
MVWLRHIVALLALAATASVSAEPLKVGDRASDFQLTMLDGSKVTMADLRGQVVVLNFWATWCGPCKAELPLLDAYYRMRKANGLRVFTIATEDSLPTFKLKPLFAAMAIPSARRIKGNYGVLGALPTNYVIDRGGIVRYAKPGAFDLDDLNSLLVPLLKDSAPAPSVVR